MKVANTGRLVVVDSKGGFYQLNDAYTGRGIVPYWSTEEEAISAAKELGYEISPSYQSKTN